MKNVVLCGLLILTVFAVSHRRAAVVRGTNGVTSVWALPDEDSWDVGTPTPPEVSADDDYGGPSFYCGNLVSDGVTANAALTYITDVFGAQRTEGYPHSGIDIGTNFEQNIPVRTPMGGKVVFAGLLEDYGFSIIIENDGYQVLLSHASSLTKGSAQVVQAGDVVMLSGGDNGDWRDGNSSGAHIHFEIRQCSEMGCRAIDPMTVLLPGQTQTCNWYQAVSDPSLNIRKAKPDSNPPLGGNLP